ncbi:class I SAM-dependent methyltransferase [Clostridium psychrophilum]|uniref:class I SAM-dependent methyltransferase n=1 Tax=Clostridium psychrophilum TaxID=132926 RepID=UPI001C0AD307|nr:class I SAM-dependent methyltransferase [Clostridium psychrophilum]MBU3180195.1 class I SAM-dependent methyltransferase [Clostridium psychrophilum]
MLDSKGFDLWSNGYDMSVNLSDESKEYPFDGYKNVLNYIYKKIRRKKNANVLDIGFGTGILTTQLYNDGYNITGVDFSSNMIDIAKLKMPNANLINYDFSKGLPDEIKNSHFDFIISTYAIHHLTAEEKIDFIKLISNMLTKTGKIFFGDVSFRTKEKLEKCKKKYYKDWDNDEDYLIAKEIDTTLGNKYLCKYTKMSQCAGILTITNVVHTTFHFRKIITSKFKRNNI